MKTALVSLCYLEGKDGLGNDRFQRYQRWIRYLREVKPLLGFDHIWLIDNASPNKLLSRIALMDVNSVHIHRFDDHLSHGEGINDYPFIWRGLWWVRELIEVDLYDKYIFLDSDAYILSSRLFHWVKHHKSGWECVGQTDHGHSPANELAVLNRDSFSKFMRYTDSPWQSKIGLRHEDDIPFTVNKDFICDRYGELRAHQRPEMDAYFQACLDIPLTGDTLAGKHLF